MPTLYLLRVRPELTHLYLNIIDFRDIPTTFRITSVMFLTSTDTPSSILTIEQSCSHIPSRKVYARPPGSERLYITTLGTYCQLSCKAAIKMAFSVVY